MSEAAAGSKVEVRLGGKTVVRIFLLDNSSKTLMIESTTTAKDICETMAEKCGFHEPKKTATFFGLFVASNGSSIDKLLSPTDEVQSEVAKWPAGSPALFVFQVKLFMETLQRSEDARVQHMLYLQAVHDVITGVYPVEADVAVRLAAMQLQDRFGDHRPAVHKPGFLTDKLREFIPAPLLRTVNKAPGIWEQEIYVEHAKLAGNTTPRASYAEELRRTDFYGCTFYVAKQKQFSKLPKTILLGVSCKGISIVKAGRKSAYLQFKLSEIYRWGFKPGASFYFEVKKVGGAGPVYEFDTAEGNIISDLLTDYAMALLRELGITTDEADAPGASGSGSGGAKMDEQFAATKLQATFRGFRLRRDLEREYAAIRVQAIWRGYRERCRFDAMIASMEAELAAQDGAPPSS